jgi:hypothetical protein
MAAATIITIIKESSELLSFSIFLGRKEFHLGDSRELPEG